LGGATNARAVDSGEYAALRGDVRAGFDANVVSSTEPLPKASREVFCDECFDALAGADSACVQV